MTARLLLAYALIPALLAMGWLLWHLMQGQQRGSRRAAERHRASKIEAKAETPDGTPATLVRPLSNKG